MTKAEIIREHFSEIGSKGGKTKGPSKLRGTRAYYKAISAKGAAARKKKKKAENNT